MEQLKEGDTVIVTSYRDGLRGRIGIVKKIIKPDCIAVEFDRSSEWLHCCSGWTTPCRGWWFFEGDLKRVEPEKPSN